MDLLDFDAQELYFEDEQALVTALLQQAAAQYSEGDAETPLLAAYALAPQSLNVLVALYRFYYYRHRLPEALQIAAKAMETLRMQLDLPSDWRCLTPQLISAVDADAKVQLRFYLFTLKAIGFLHMRLYDLALSREIFEKLVELDGQDRIGAAGLLQLAVESLAQYEPA